MQTIVEHPLIRVHITALRAKETGADAFRNHLTAISRLLAFPALADLAIEPVRVVTPLTETEGGRLRAVPVLVPVLRAGLGMVEGFRDVIPDAIVSHLGMYRDHQTLLPVRYYSNFPKDCGTHPFIVLDPMLATGGSAVDAIDYLKSEGVRNIRVVAVIAAPEGMARVFETHPDVHVYAGVQDQRLNQQGYILPGLGDAGDRQFGTV
ncbi:MAG: uracil phosphoribosyltransferase [Thermaerobacter sp.]|nr:uracil phosphoribosyltransferase [Thermaerobacter sp.]